MLYSSVLTNSIPYDSYNQKFCFWVVLGENSIVVEISAWPEEEWSRKSYYFSRFYIFCNRCICPMLIDS